MTATSVLKAARDAGVTIVADGNELILRGATQPDVTLVDQVRDFKTEILDLLRMPVWSSDDWQAWFDERAAILEYDGGHDRDVAELQAAEDLEALREGRLATSVVAALRERHGRGRVGGGHA
jgi:hypothetical protein